VAVRHAADLASARDARHPTNSSAVAATPFVLAVRHRADVDAAEVATGQGLVQWANDPAGQVAAPATRSAGRPPGAPHALELCPPCLVPFAVDRDIDRRAVGAARVGRRHGAGAAGLCVRRRVAVVVERRDRATSDRRWCSPAAVRFAFSPGQADPSEVGPPFVARM
jgi:hypothetical protein